MKSLTLALKNPRDAPRYLRQSDLTLFTHLEQRGLVVIDQGLTAKRAVTDFRLAKQDPRRRRRAIS